MLFPAFFVYFGECSGAENTGNFMNYFGIILFVKELTSLRMVAATHPRSPPQPAKRGLSGDPGSGADARGLRGRA